MQMIPERIKVELAQQAHAKHGVVLPVATKRRLEDCFFAQQGQAQLWFQGLDGNTHMVSAALDSNPPLPAPPFSSCGPFMSEQEIAKQEAQYPDSDPGL